jgi:type IV fimbrial biogenesis protein FimT
VLRPAQKGVSLIETLVALVIVSVLLVAGAPSFASFMQNRKIRNAAEALHNGLSLAKAEAVRRNTIITFTLGTGAAWALTCTLPCNSSDLPSMPAGEISSDIAITSTDAILNFTGFGKVSNVLTAGSAAAGSFATFEISNTKGSCEVKGGSMRCLRLEVTPGGQIRSCDPRLTVTNPTSPQACPVWP